MFGLILVISKHAIKALSGLSKWVGLLFSESNCGLERTGLTTTGVIPITSGSAAPRRPFPGKKSDIPAQRGG